MSQCSERVQRFCLCLQKISEVTGIRGSHLLFQEEVVPVLQECSVQFQSLYKQCPSLQKAPTSGGLCPHTNWPELSLHFCCFQLEKHFLHQTSFAGDVGGEWEKKVSARKRRELGFTWKGSLQLPSEFDLKPQFCLLNLNCLFPLLNQVLPTLISKV